MSAAQFSEARALVARLEDEERNLAKLTRAVSSPRSPRKVLELSREEQVTEVASPPAEHADVSDGGGPPVRSRHRWGQSHKLNVQATTAPAPESQHQALPEFGFPFSAASTTAPAPEDVPESAFPFSAGLHLSASHVVLDPLAKPQSLDEGSPWPSPETDDAVNIWGVGDKQAHGAVGKARKRKSAKQVQDDFVRRHNWSLLEDQRKGSKNKTNGIMSSDSPIETIVADQLKSLRDLIEANNKTLLSDVSKELLNAQHQIAMELAKEVWKPVEENTQLAPQDAHHQNGFSTIRDNWRPHPPPLGENTRGNSKESPEPMCNGTTSPCGTASACGPSSPCCYGKAAPLSPLPAVTEDATVSPLLSEGSKRSPENEPLRPTESTAVVDKENWLQKGLHLLKNVYYHGEFKIHRESVRDDTDELELAASSKAGIYKPPVRNVFPDGDQIKRDIMAALEKQEYNVADYYKTEGRCQELARHAVFENMTFLVIVLNSLWIAIELDNNGEPLHQASPVFFIVESLFCIYFTFEWGVRFGAFATKCDSLKDGWFCFDSFLVFFMIVDTWILTFFLVVTDADAEVGGASVLRLLRLARLTRTARIVRLLRSFPELIVLSKGIMLGFPSVFFTIFLLLIITYMFSIMLAQLSDESPELKENYFDTVPDAMKNLLILAGCPDLGDAFADVGDAGWLLGVVFLIYVVLASLTVLNMLVGVLVTVITVVSNMEKEQIMLQYVNEEMQKHLAGVGIQGSDKITHDRFKQLLVSQKCRNHSKPKSTCQICQAYVRHQDALLFLKGIGVDVLALVDYCDVIFKGDKEMEYGDVVKLVMELRGTNISTVKDIVELRKWVDKVMDEKVHKIARILAVSNDQIAHLDVFDKIAKEEVPHSTKALKGIVDGKINEEMREANRFLQCIQSFDARKREREAERERESDEVVNSISSTRSHGKVGNRRSQKARHSRKFSGGLDSLAINSVNSSAKGSQDGKSSSEPLEKTRAPHQDGHESDQL